MLGRALASVGGLLGCDAERHVAIHRDSPAPGLVDDREVGLAGEVFVDLDEIGAIRGQLFHRGPCLRCGAHDDRVAPQGRIAIERRACGEESGWPAKLPLGQPAPDRLGQLEPHVGRSVVHVANTSDAVGEEQREVPVPRRDRLEGFIHRHVRHRVDVHVPQAWDEEAACGVEQVRIVRYPDLVSRADGRDAIARNKNGLVTTERSVDHIDDGDRSDGHGRGPRRTDGEQKASHTQQDLHRRTS